jgi:hypothetical protein
MHEMEGGKPLPYVPTEALLDGREEIVQWLCQCRMRKDAITQNGSIPHPEAVMVGTVGILTCLPSAVKVVNQTKLLFSTYQ